MQIVKLNINTEPAQKTVAVLATLPPEVLQAFLKSVKFPASLFCINLDSSVARGANNLSFVVEPSKLLADFLMTV